MASSGVHGRSEEHTSELQSHRDLHSFPTRRSSDLTNIKYLNEHGVRIWDEWADERGDLGPVYGQQWRSWPAKDGQTIDQMTQVIDMIKRNQDSRRLIVTAWNPAEVDKMTLPP